MCLSSGSTGGDSARVDEQMRRQTKGTLPVPDTGGGREGRERGEVAAVIQAAKDTLEHPDPDSRSVRYFEHSLNTFGFSYAVDGFTSLFEQAQRIEELEEALRFYADPSSYGATPPGPAHMRWCSSGPLFDDLGARARAALEGER